MKLIDAINRVRRDKNNETLFDIAELFAEFDLPWLYTDDHSFKEYWLQVWLCTDTWVGTSVIFLNDQPVAVRTQNCRKCSSRYDWLSNQAYELVRTELLRLSDKEREDMLSIIDHDEKIDEFFRLPYVQSIIDMTAWLDEEKVSIVHPKDITSTTVSVQLNNGELRTVDVSDLLFKIRVTEEPQ